MHCFGEAKDKYLHSIKLYLVLSLGQMYGDLAESQTHLSILPIIISHEVPLRIDKKDKEMKDSD